MLTDSRFSKRECVLEVESFPLAVIILHWLRDRLIKKNEIHI